MGVERKLGALLLFVGGLSLCETAREQHPIIWISSAIRSWLRTACGVHRVISISCVALAATSLFAGCSSSGDDTVNFGGNGGETAGNHSGGAGAHAGSGVGGGAAAGEAGAPIGGGSGEGGEPDGTAGTGETGGTSGSAGGPTGGGSSGMSGGGSSGAAAGGTASIAGGGMGGSGTAGTAGTGTAGSGGKAGSGGTGGTSGGGTSGGGTGGGGTSGGGTSGGGTSGGGTGGATASCGNGVVEAGEACDTADGTCSNTCTKVSNATCLTCENNGTCSDFVFNCLGPTASPFNATQQTQCNAVLSCIESSNCFDGTGTLGGTCYCGSLSLTDCQAAPFSLSAAGAPNGPCAAKIQAGLPGVTTNAAVLGGLTASAKPAGAAMQRLNCDKTADGAACLSACGFTTGGPAFP